MCTFPTQSFLQRRHRNLSSQWGGRHGWAPLLLLWQTRDLSHSKICKGEEGASQAEAREVKAGVPGSGLLQAQEGCPGAKPVKRHYLEIGTWWE